MKKVRILTRKLPILVLFLFLGCNDDSMIELQQNETNYTEPLFKSTTIYKQQIEANEKLSKKMSKLITSKNELMSKNIYNDTYDFTIYTDVAKFVENINNNTHSYTFSIGRNNDTSSVLENLVFSYNNVTDNYDAGLVTYHFTTEQKQEYLTNSYVSTPYEISFESLEINISDVLSKNQLPCTVTYQEYHIPDGSNTSHLHTTNGHVNNACEHGNDEIPCETYTVITITCPNSGSSPDGNGLDDNTPPADTSDNSTIGGSGNSNSGNTTTNDSNDNDIVTTIISPEEVTKKSILDCINGISLNDTTVIDVEIFNQINLTANELADIENFLNDNNCSEFAQEQIIQQLLEEFEEIFKDDNFTNNNCLNTVYTELGKSSTFNRYLKNFEPKFSVAHLRFSASTTMADSINALTFPPENYLIKIEFNANNLQRPKLAIARTFIHETIHAEIFRKLLSISQHPSIRLTQNQIIQLRNNYPGLYDYYMRWQWNVPQGQSASSAQHEAMAQHYRGVIINALREYDNTQTDEVYEALAWVGLEGTVAWNNLSQTEITNIQQTIINFYANNPNCQ